MSAADDSERVTPKRIRPSRARMARQLIGTLRLEIRRSLFAKRALAVAFLAFAPLVLVFFWAVSPFPTREFDSVQEAATVFAFMFEAYLRVSIFFSALFLFVNLYRAEILEKSLHYYFLAPVRREVVAAGKYLSALAIACGFFVAGATLLFFLTTIPWGASEFVTYVLRGPGLSNLMAYLSVVVLACAGYGAIFLVIGLVFRNAVIPAAILWIWEAANVVLPPLLKKLSVVYYLQALYPIPLTKTLFEVVAEPPPVWVAVSGAVVVTAGVLALAGWRVRRMEVSYGGD